MLVKLSQAQAPLPGANILAHTPRHLETSFSEVEVEFYNLHETTENNRYSSGVFKDGKRKKDNCIGFGNILIYDIDNDSNSILSLATAVELFSDIQSLIVTTKSHQKEKNGVIADRFRIGIQLDSDMSISVDEYSEFYMDCASVFWIDKYIDKSCKDVARMYQPNPNQEVYYSSSKNTISEKQLRISFEEKKFLDNSIREAIFTDATADYSSSKIDYLRSILQTQSLLELLKYDEKFVAGNRNNYLYSVGCYLMDNQLSKIEVRDTLVWMNSLKSSLKEMELNSTIMRSLKI